MEFKIALTFCITLVVICVLFLIRSLYNDYLVYRKERDVIAFEDLKEQINSFTNNLSFLIRENAYLRRQMSYLDSDINILFNLFEKERKKHEE